MFVAESFSFKPQLRLAAMQSTPAYGGTIYEYSVHYLATQWRLEFGLLFPKRAAESK